MIIVIIIIMIIITKIVYDKPGIRKKAKENEKWKATGINIDKTKLKEGTKEEVITKNNLKKKKKGGGGGGGERNNEGNKGTQSGKLRGRKEIREKRRTKAS